MSPTASASHKPSWLSRLTAPRARPRDRLRPLYEAIVAYARRPIWYREGGVPDSVTGRFDVLAAITALVLVRMEAMADEEAKPASVLLTETFIADMDESLLEIGIGDYSVGKHVGRLVGALGGRLTVFRQAAADGDFDEPVRRNIFHDTPPSDTAVALVAEQLQAFARGLELLALDDLLAGRLPR